VRNDDVMHLTVVIVHNNDNNKNNNNNTVQTNNRLLIHNQLHIQMKLVVRQSHPPRARADGGYDCETIHYIISK